MAAVEVAGFCFEGGSSDNMLMMRRGGSAINAMWESEDFECSLFARCHLAFARVFVEYFYTCVIGCATVASVNKIAEVGFPVLCLCNCQEQIEEKNVLYCWEKLPYEKS